MNSIREEMIGRSLFIYEHIARCEDKRAVDTDIEGRKWMNPDNWAYGSLGRAFYAAELYRHTREKRLWDDLVMQLSRIEERLKERRSGNYTLYFGRIGLAFLYKRLFDMMRHEPFLARATAIAREYDSRRLTFKDKSSLAEGTAGFLLFCLSLYPDVKAQWLQDILYRQVELLIDQAEAGNRGIYWKGNGVTGRCYSGLAYGTSGIALALLALAKVFREKRFLRMADLALQCEDGFGGGAEAGDMPTTAVDWNQKGLMHGELGKSLVRLYRGSIIKSMDDSANWDATIRTLSRILEGPQAGDIPMGIADGLSGWGVALFEGYALTKNRLCLDCVNRIGSMLMERSGNEMAFYRSSKGFWYGPAGIGYFLLQLSAAGTPGFLILPEFARPLPEHAAGGADLYGEDQVRLPDPGRRLLSRSMRKSMRILEEGFPAETDSFFEMNYVPSPADLIRFAAGLDSRKLTGGKENLLTRAMEKEYYMTNVNKALFHGDDRGNNERIFKINKIFRLSIDDFMLLRLVVADNLLLLDQEEALDLDFDKKVSLELLEYLLTVYGRSTFLFTMNKFNFLEEITLGTMKLFMLLFAREDTVQSAFDRFIGFFKLQNREVVEGLKATLRCYKDKQLIQEVKKLFFRNIRALLIHGILDCTNIGENEVSGSYSDLIPFIGLADATLKH